MCQELFVSTSLRSPNRGIQLFTKLFLKSTKNFIESYPVYRETLDIPGTSMSSVLLSYRRLIFERSFFEIYKDDRIYRLCIKRSLPVLYKIFM